jgi:hypothetical protein
VRWGLSALVAVAGAGCADSTSVPREASSPNPDSVSGTDPQALQRPANLRRALARLEKERQGLEGRYSSLRIAPGRIDTEIAGPQRTMNLQIRPDMSIPFVTTRPTSVPDRDGLVGSDVDVKMPERLLARIDKRRSSNAAGDLDYIVVAKSNIDRTLSWSAFLDAGPRPRSFLLEEGRLRPIG